MYYTKALRYLVYVILAEARACMNISRKSLRVGQKCLIGILIGLKIVFSLFCIAGDCAESDVILSNGPIAFTIKS